MLSIQSISLGFTVVTSVEVVVWNVVETLLATVVVEVCISVVAPDIDVGAVVGEFFEFVVEVCISVVVVMEFAVDESVSGTTYAIA